MIIGVDAGCLGIKDKRLKVGVYYMAKNLFEALGKIDTQNTYLLYSFYPIENNILKSFGSNVRNVVVSPTRGWTKIWLPLRLRRDKPDIFVGLNQTLPLRLPLQQYKTIVIIHDLLFEQYPKLYPKSFGKLHKESKSATQNADRVIAVSEATKRDIQEYYKTPDQKIVVSYEGIRTFPAKGKQNTKYKIQNTKYFLFVGALKPQKNVPMLLQAFAKINPHLNPLPVGEEDHGISLFIVGGDKWRDKEIDIAFTLLPKNVQQHIHFLGVVDDATLANLYKHAIAFVSPSLSEGFGLTFLESLSFGTPIIGPHKGAIPEVIGEAGILVDPKNENEIVGAMQKMLDKKIYERFQQKAKIQVTKFSWETFAKKFLLVVSDVTNSTNTS